MTQNSSDHEQHKDPATEAPPNWRQVIGSALAAAFGVQSKENRERDFQHGKPIVFIATGIVLTVLFVVGMIAVVTTVIRTAG